MLTFVCTVVRIVSGRSHDYPPYYLCHVRAIYRTVNDYHEPAHIHGQKETAHEHGNFAYCNNISERLAAASYLSSQLSTELGRVDPQAT